MVKVGQKIHGFTLVELMIVIVILGILATIAMPKFVDLADKARIASDDAVIGALASAINIQHAQNALSGTKNASGEYWPSDNPFTLLAQAPPNKYYNSSTPDNITWQTFQVEVYSAWYIMCPHYVGNEWCSAPTKGRFYMYQYGEDGVWGHRAGDVWLYWPPSG